jgi:hypothetical protein
MYLHRLSPPTIHPTGKKCKCHKIFKDQCRADLYLSFYEYSLAAKTMKVGYWLMGMSYLLFPFFQG